MLSAMGKGESSAYTRPRKVRAITLVRKFCWSNCPKGSSGCAEAMMEIGFAPPYRGQTVPSKNHATRIYFLAVRSTRILSRSLAKRIVSATAPGDPSTIPDTLFSIFRLIRPISVSAGSNLRALFAFFPITLFLFVISSLISVIHISCASWEAISCSAATAGCRASESMFTSDRFTNRRSWSLVKMMTPSGSSC